MSAQPTAANAPATPAGTTSTSSQNLEWSISSFYQRAWQLAKTHKKLWILGLAVAMYSGSLNSNLEVPDFPSDTNTPQQEQQLEESTNDFNSAAVLGEMDELNFEDLENIDWNSPEDVQRFTQDLNQTEPPATGEEVETWTGEDYMLTDKQFAPPGQHIADDIMAALSTVSPLVYALLALELLAMIVAVIILGLALQAWSKAALIAGIKTADETNAVDLRQAAQTGVAKIKPMLWLMIVPMLKWVLMVLGLGLVAVILAALIHPALGVILFLIGLLYLMHQLVLIIAGLVMGERELVFNAISGKEAFERGRAMAKNWRGKMFILGLVTWLLVFLIGIVLLAPLAGGLVWSFLSTDTSSLVFLVPVLASAAVVLMPFLFLANALYKVFTYAVWHSAYQVIRGAQPS